MPKVGREVTVVWESGKKKEEESNEKTQQTNVEDERQRSGTNVRDVGKHKTTNDNTVPKSDHPSKKGQILFIVMMRAPMRIV